MPERACPTQINHIACFYILFQQLIHPLKFVWHKNESEYVYQLVRVMVF